VRVDRTIINDVARLEHEQAPGPGTDTRRITATTDAPVVLRMAVGDRCR
jgi:hypothetical protein